MKKLIALLLALVMMSAVFAGCNTEKTEDAGAAAKANYEGTMEDLVNAIVEKAPVQFMGGFHPVDLTDTTEDGIWALKNYTGLESAEELTDIAAYESMMGAQAFSLVAVRVADGADVKAVAQEMTDNIDTRKWICVEANDKIVVGCGDVVMLIMLDNTNGMTAQSFVDAFVEVMGAELDFTI